jgi:hypothetical protein
MKIKKTVVVMVAILFNSFSKFYEVKNYGTYRFYSD